MAVTRRVRRGFSLLELLVALVVIAVLSTLAVPQFTQAIDRSRIRADESSLGALARQAAALAALDETAVTATHLDTALGDCASCTALPAGLPTANGPWVYDDDSDPDGDGDPTISSAYGVIAVGDAAGSTALVMASQSAGTWVWAHIDTARHVRTGHLASSVSGADLAASPPATNSSGGTPPSTSTPAPPVAATPTFALAGTDHATSWSTGTLTLTRTFPVDPGDLVVLSVSGAQGFSNASAAGFDVAQGSAGGDVSIVVLYRFATATEPDSYTVNLSGGYGRKAWLSGYATNGAPVHLAGSASRAGITSPSLQSNGHQGLLLTTATANSGNNNIQPTFTPPAGMAEVADTGTVNMNGRSGHALFSEITTAAPTGARTAAASHGNNTATAVFFQGAGEAPDAPWAMIAANVSYSYGGTVTVPAYTSVRAGDLLVLGVSGDAISGVAADGFSTVVDGSQTVLLYKRATGNEPDRYQVSFAAGTGRKVHHVAYRAPAAGFRLEAGEAGRGGTTSRLISAGNPALAVALFSSNSANNYNAGTFTPPAGWTERADTGDYSTASGLDFHGRVSTMVADLAGAHTVLEPVTVTSQYGSQTNAAAIFTADTAPVATTWSLLGGSAATSWTSDTIVDRHYPVQAGDLLVAVISGQDVTGPAGPGWTLVRTTAEMGVFYRVATADEPASYTFSASGWGRKVTVLAYRAPANVALVADAATTGLTSPTVTAPDGALVLSVYRANSGNNNVAPSFTITGARELADTGERNQHGRVSHLVADATAGGGTGGGWTATSTHANNTAVTVAFAGP